MAPIRSTKYTKATGARYNPIQARTTSAPPQSVPEIQKYTDKLTWGHGSNRMYTYQDAIKRCDSFIRSKDYAKSLAPELTLDYIPMSERWNCQWLASHTLKCPKRGNLYWIGKGPRPDSDKAMQATKLFVIEEWVGSEVEHLVKEVQKVKRMSWYRDYTATRKANERLIKRSLNDYSTPHLIRRLEEWERNGKEKAVPKWVADSPEWWFRLSDVEAMKKVWEREQKVDPPTVRMMGVAHIVEKWCKQPGISITYQEVLKKLTFGDALEVLAQAKEGWKEEEVMDWLDQKAWDKGNDDLAVDMADLLLEPLNEDEEWLKLTEEAWSAEAPNGGNNVKSHLPPADF